jgi:putative nucleotidyltransferase with HDIG domain
MTGPQDSSASSFAAGRAARVWPIVRVWILALALVASQVAILAVPLLPSGRVAIEVGDQATQDFRAPFTKTYVSPLRTAAERDQAAQAIAPVYSPPDTAIARQRVQRAQQVLELLDSIRADPYVTPELAVAWAEAIPDVALPPQAVRQVLTLSDGDWTNRVRPEILNVLDQAMRGPIRPDSLARARAEVVLSVSLGLSEDKAQTVISIVQAFLVPNSQYDAVATEGARQAAREAVGEVRQTYARGDLLVAQGQRVSETDIEALDQFGMREPTDNTIALGSTVALVAVVAALLGLYVQRFHAGYWQDLRYLLVFGLLFTLWVLGAKLSIPGRTVLPYLFPAAALAMLLTVLLDAHLAIVAGMLLSLVIGYVSGGSLELLAYALAGSLVAALTLRRVERIASFFWTGIFVGLAGALVVLAFRLPAGTSQDALIALLTLVAAAIVNGLLSAGMTLAGFFVLGGVFDILTTIQLHELARPNHPLLQKILREAPGSYHHSLLVANLAEQAAERIGADALLVRVGAYYHDVGKSVKPYLFIENQIEGANVHEHLDPLTSATMLIRHVREGVELARRHRLPRRVRAFIPEHHGTLRVSFLYQKALEAAEDPEAVREADFRYPGPRPQSRETAVLMLADGCEAAVRAIRPGSVEELEQIVRRVINERVADGQLDECSLTLRDLHAIADSFVATLKGVFHPRLKYPPAGAEGDEAALRDEAESAPHRDAHGDAHEDAHEDAP